jgi:membrane protein YqaA with SNARE-associated domain
VIGAAFFAYVGEPLIDFYGYAHAFEDARGLFQSWGVWAVLIGGLTPIPFKVVTIAAGLFAFNPVLFTVSALVARGLRFFVEAGLLWRYGAPIQAFVERRLNLLATAFIALLLLGFLALELL